MVAAEYPICFANSSRVRSIAFRLSLSQVPKECCSIQLYLIRNVTLFVTIFVTHGRGRFATLWAQRPTRVSENMKSGLPRTGETMKKKTLVTTVILLALLATL